MNITVFGASGGIGSRVVTLAAQRGHHVLAVYREAPTVPPPDTAEIVIAPDVFDRSFAAAAVRTADTVVCALPRRRRLAHPRPRG